MSTTILTSDCFDASSGPSFNFTAFIDQPRSFDDTIPFCEAQDQGIAQIKDEQISDQLLGFIQEVVDQINENGGNPVQSNGFFVGLSREADTDAQDPNSFRYVDGDPIAEFANTRSVFPWFDTLPNGNDEDRLCAIALHIGLPPETSWFNFECDVNGNANFFFSLCQTECGAAAAEENNEIDDGADGDENLTTLIGAATGGVMILALGILFLFFYTTRQVRRLESSLVLMKQEHKIKNIKHEGEVAYVEGFDSEYKVVL